MRRTLILLILPLFILSATYLGPLHAPAWTGLVYVRDGDCFAFRIAFEKEGILADNYDTFYLISEVGPRDPQSSYARLGLDLFLPFKLGRATPIIDKRYVKDRQTTLEWGKIEKGFVGRLSRIPPLKVLFIFYRPWFKKPTYIFKNGEIIGGEGRLRLRFRFLNRVKIVEEKKERLVVEVIPEKGQVYFYASSYPVKFNTALIDSLLQERAKAYEAERPRWKGEWEGLISSISNNLFWMILYQPDKNRLYIPAGRKWIFPAPDGTRDYWTIFEWDAFFNALEASVESKQIALAEIKAVLETQYPWGNIPNWRSARGGTPDRSQPPVGSFVVWKIFHRTGDTRFLKISYNALKKWYHFWTAPNVNGVPRRDGNRNLLLEWGSDEDKLSKTPPPWEKGVDGRQRAAWESGQDDLPNFDKVKYNPVSGSLEMDCIDLSSLHALDAWCLAEMAEILGYRDEAVRFRRDFEKIKERINSILWNKKEGFYFDRFWNGRFSKHKASSNFYPLLAGVASRAQAESMLRHLLNEKEFWGDFVIPTISKDNPAYKDQQYWRGTIWPPTNYLVYHGLRRYGYDRIASEFAVKSARLFLRSWRRFALCRENYSSITGEGGGQRYQSWGPLFALILLEDFIDWTGWEGLRVSNLSASSCNRIENLKLRGRTFYLEACGERLLLRIDGRDVLSFEGKAVVKHLRLGQNAISFEVKAVRPTSVKAFLAGKSFAIVVDEHPTKSSSPELKVPAGRHYIEIKRLR